MNLNAVSSLPYHSPINKLPELLFFLVGVEGQPTVQTPTEIHGNQPVDVKKIAATGTFDEGGNTAGDAGQDEPDGENLGRFPVRLGDGQGRPDERDVDQNHPPQVPAPLAYLAQSIGILAEIFVF